MKKVIFSLLIICIISSNETSTYGQSEVKEAELSYYGSLPSIDRKFTEVINSNLFLIYNSLGYHRSCILAVDKDLVEKFRIKIDHGNYFPFFKYDAKNDKLIVIEVGKASGLHYCYAKTYDLNGKLITQKAFKSPEKGEYNPQIKFSEDNNLFMVYAFTGKKGKNLSYTIYDNSLALIYSKELASSGKEQVIDVEVNSKGEAFIVHKGSDGLMRFEKYDAKGDLLKELKSNKLLAKKETYGDFQVTYKNNVVYTAISKHLKDNFIATNVFSADFNKDTAFGISSIHYTKENLNKIYSETKNLEAKSNTLSITTPSNPENLHDYTISNILVEDNRVYVISECLYKKTEVSKKDEYPVYYAENILVSAYSLKPDTNIWNKIIYRKNQDKDNISNLAIQEWSAIKSESYLDKNCINLLTLQSLKDDFSEESLYIRKINKDSGEIDKSARLLKDSFSYDRNFTNWLDQFHLIIYRANRTTLITKFLIDIIEVD